MTISLKIKAAFAEAQVSDHTGAGASYAAFGVASTEVIVALIITSTFDQAVFLSTDGTLDMILVPGSGAVISIDLSGNKQGTAKLAFAVGTQFFLKEGPDGPPTSGDISITPIFAR